MKMKQPRFRDEAHLAAIRKCPCLRCETSQGIQAAHIRMLNLEWGQKAGIRTGAGGGEKPADVWVVPLCVDCHLTGPNAEHRVGTLAFWERCNVDPHEVAWELWKVSGNIERMRSVIFMARYMGLGRVRAIDPA